MVVWRKKNHGKERDAIISVTIKNKEMVRKRVDEGEKEGDESFFFSFSIVGRFSRRKKGGEEGGARERVRRREGRTHIFLDFPFFLTIFLFFPRVMSGTSSKIQKKRKQRQRSKETKAKKAVTCTALVLNKNQPATENAL